MGTPHFDVLVIGSGVGGVVAAARLSNAGRRILLVERLDRVGGRASTIERDGFRINTGAAFWEFGGSVEETCRLVGAPFDVRPVKRAVVYRAGRRDVCIDRIFGSRLQRLLLGAIARSASGAMSDDDVSVADWLARRTRNASIRTTVHNLCGAVFAAGSEEVSMRVFLSFFTKESAFAELGLGPQGMVGVMQALADAAVTAGAEVWMGSEVRTLELVDQRAHRARIARAGEIFDITCDTVVSNLGPAATAHLCPAGALSAEYIAAVERMKPCTLLAANFATERPITTRGFGALLFGRTERLLGAVEFTQTCPEMAPSGWNLYVAWSMPRASREPFDEKREKRLLLDDLGRQFAEFARARLLSLDVLSGTWPAQRALSGFDLPRSTPIPNLWNVGDGVKKYATGGTEACAQSAVLTVLEILRRDARTEHGPLSAASR